MEFLSSVNSDKSLTTREYVHEYVQETGGHINVVKVDGVALPIVAADKSVDVVNKVNQKLEGQDGDSYIINDNAGGMLKFIHDDGTESIVRVKDGGDNGEAASIGAYKDAKGAKMIVRTDGIFIIQDKTTIDTENDKVATLGNIPYPYFSAAKKAEPTEGYFATYYIADKKGDQCGVDINIPRDFLVKKAEMKVCEVEGVPETTPALKVGDPYIDLTINVKEGETEESHLYINVKGLVDIYTAGNKGIDITDNKVSAVVVNANGLAIGNNGIELSVASTSANGAMTSGQVTKLDGIEENAEVNVVDTVDSAIFEIADRQLQSAKLTGIEAGAQVNKVETIDSSIFELDNKQLKSAKLSGIESNAQVNKVESIDETIFELVDRKLQSAKLSGVESGAQVNKIESVDANFVIDADKKLGIATGKQFMTDAQVTKLNNAITEHQSLTEYRKSADQDVIDAGKQDVISDLDTIRSGAALGATAIQSHQSLAEYRKAADQDAIHDATKQNVISDLSTIRSGATLGATALQSVPSTYRTSAEQDVIDAGKQATISDLDTIRSGAALGATAIQSHQSLAEYRKAADQDAIHDATKQDVISDLDSIRNNASAGAAVAARIPAAPTTDGTYVLKCTVAGGVPTYTWEVEA